MNHHSPTCLSFWFPRIKDRGLPVPRTEVVTTDIALVDMLDGKQPEGIGDFLSQLMRGIVNVGGTPCFIRTGYGSDKHRWGETCYLRTVTSNAVLQHVYNLVEWSHTVDIVGLPTDVWALRKLIDTEPMFHAFDGMPITREFRVFVRDGVIEHHQPYWPNDAIEQGRPDSPDWRLALERASSLERYERVTLAAYAQRACLAVGGGYWSVDFLQDAKYRWWLTDMAEGDLSFRYTP